MRGSLKFLVVLFTVFTATAASAYMTVHTIKERDALGWKAEQNRERAVFIALKYRTLEQKYKEQETLLSSCRGN